MEYKYAYIGTKKQQAGDFVKHLPAAFFDGGRVIQFISNPDDIPQILMAGMPTRLKAGLFVYNPDDQFARFVTEKELNEALALKGHAILHLQEAHDLFNQEGLETKDTDPEGSKAAFEDAALVRDTIESIENGNHRGRLTYEDEKTS